MRSVTDLLKKVFCPAGIYFAVAEDGFCSCDATSEEIERYIESYKSMHYQKLAIRMTSERFVGTAYRKYGYVRIDADQLDIDPEPAGIIQRIYAEFCNGKTVKEIADQLNTEGIETPNQYRWRHTGRKEQQENSIWRENVIVGILRNETYMGKWTVRHKEDKRELPCPVIIEKTVFDQVQEQIRSLHKEYHRHFHTLKGTYTICPGKVFDEETNWPLRIGNRADKKVFRFQYPAPSIRMYDKLFITPDEISGAIYDDLEKEHQKAKTALEQLNMPETKVRLEERLKPIRDEALTMYQQMAQTERMYVELAKQRKTTQDETIEMQCDTLLSVQAEQDQKLQEILDRMERMEKCYSNQNPWVALYMGYNPQKPFSSETDRKYVERILVHRFEYAYLVPKEQEWYLELPQEWFTED